jgi:hypothetical protein
MGKSTINYQRVHPHSIPAQVFDPGPLTVFRALAKDVVNSRTSAWAMEISLR